MAERLQSARLSEALASEGASRFREFVRVMTTLSLLGAVFSIAFPGQVCYTCDGPTLMTIVLVHGVLIVATFSRNMMMSLLALVLVVFYASRTWIIQLDAGSFTYAQSLPTITEMRTVMSVFVVAVGSLVFGCYLGGAMRLSRPTGVKTNVVLPFAVSIDSRRFYYVIATWFIVGEALRLYLFATAGIGLPISRELLDLRLLRLSKSVEVLTPLSAVPAAWLLLQRPRGREKGYTILAATLYVLVQISTFSKVGLIYAIMPFVLAYVAADRPVPRGLALKAAMTVLLVAFVVSSAVSTVRRSLESVYQTGDRFQLESFSLDIGANVSSFFGRVGSSFDVLAFVVLNQHAFLPYLDVAEELRDIPNTYVPGQLVQANPPRWAALLYALGHDADYESGLRTALGENITLPGYLYVNSNLLGMAFGCFIVMFAFSAAYRNVSAAAVRVFLLTTVFFELPNGSGIISTAMTAANFVGMLVIARIVYFALFAAMRRSSDVRDERAVAAAVPAFAVHVDAVRQSEFTLGNIEE